MSRYQSCYSLEDNSTSCPIVYSHNPDIVATTLRLNWDEAMDLMRQSETLLKKFISDWGLDEPEGEPDLYERFEADQDRTMRMLEKLTFAVPEEVHYSLQDEIAQGQHNWPTILEWLQRVIADSVAPF